MLLKRSWKGVALNVLIIVLLALPLVAGAQTTGTGAAGATSGTGSATAAQTNGITSPRDMAALSGTVEVRGFANDPNFLKWQLDLLPNNNANAAIFLAVGEEPGEFTYSFDTTRWPAGEHTLRLRVVRTNSNYDEYFTKFTLGGAAAGGQTGGATTGQTGATTGQTGAAAGQTGATTGQTGAAAGQTSAATGQSAGATSGQGVTTNGLAAPSEGQNISGQFVIRGFASDPNFMKWQLDLLPGGNANQAVFLAVGEATGVFTHTLNTTNLPAGQHQLRLRVVRMDSNYNEYFTNFTIGGATTGGATTGQTTGATTGGTTAGTATGGAATSGTTGGATTGGTTGGATGGQMTNGITAPREGATVSGQVQITGYANTPDFLKWQLDLLPGGNANQGAFLAFGEKAGEFTYTLDTTNLPAGEHALRLRVVRSDSNYDEYVTKFTVSK